MLCLVAPVVQAEVINGLVVRVVDSDTYYVKTTDGRRLKVRLALVQCAEAGTIKGDSLTQLMTTLLLNQHVTLDIHGLGYYKRHIAHVYYLDTDVNQFLLDNHCPPY